MGTAGACSQIRCIGLCSVGHTGRQWYRRAQLTREPEMRSSVAQNASVVYQARQWLWEGPGFEGRCPFRPRVIPPAGCGVVL